MKTIGVLGGLGPQATMDFEARVHRVSQRLIPRRGNAGYPPMVVCYFRAPPLVVPPNGTMPTARPPANPALLAVAPRLGEWADFLVLTSNGVHGWQRDIEAAAARPVASMIAATMAEVRRRGCSRVGIVDFRPPHLSIYVEPVRASSIVECVLLACTEFPLILDVTDLTADVINPIAYLAEAAVRAAVE